MEYRQLGSAGVRVSVIGLGTNQFGGKVDQQGVTAIVNKALDLGVNFIDTANVYQQGGSEQMLGVALQGRRKELVLATKFYFKVGEGPNDGGASRYHIMQAVEASLRRLGTDHIDLYQVHRWDEATPIEETLRALDDLVSAGKLLYLGASAFASWQLAHANLLAETRGWHRFVTLQSHYHMFEREVERQELPYCRAHGVGFIPYFPLAGGFLTGKYRRDEAPPPGSRGESSQYVQRYMTPSHYARVERLQQWAGERQRPLAHLAHAWLLAQKPVCSVISGATRPEHVEMNAAAHDWCLSEEELAEVNAILDGESQDEEAK